MICFNFYTHASSFPVNNCASLSYVTWPKSCKLLPLITFYLFMLLVHKRPQVLVPVSNGFKMFLMISFLLFDICVPSTIRYTMRNSYALVNDCNWCYQLTFITLDPRLEEPWFSPPYGQWCRTRLIIRHFASVHVCYSLMVSWMVGWKRSITIFIWHVSEFKSFLWIRILKLSCNYLVAYNFLCKVLCLSLFCHDCDKLRVGKWCSFIEFNAIFFWSFLFSLLASQ